MTRRRRKKTRTRRPELLPLFCVLARRRDENFARDRDMRIGLLLESADNLHAEIKALEDDRNASPSLRCLRRIRVTEKKMPQ